MQALPRSVRFGYSLGSLTAGAFGTVPGLLLLPYFTDSLGVAAFLAGALVLVPKAWDVIFNPIVGHISDSTVSPIGPRRPFVMWGGLAAAVCFALIFAAPFGTADIAAPAWAAVLFVLCATAYAFFQVPWSAMPAEMTADPLERTTLLTWRIAILAVAILVCGAVAPGIADSGDGGLGSHRLMGLFVAVVMVVGTLGAYFGSRKAPIGPTTESEPSLRQQFAVARTNKPYVGLLACFIIQGAGIATMLAGVNYFAEQVLHEDAAKTILFVAFVGPALIVMPLWTRLGARLGKRASFVLASLVFGLGALLLGLTVWLDLPAAVSYVVTMLVGIGYAGEQVFALSMLPDCIAYDTARTGKQQGGVFAGLWTAGETFGYAFGPGIFALFLAVSGYVSHKAGEHPVQPHGVELGVTLGFTVVPAVLMIGALWLVRSYPTAPADEWVAVPSAA